MPSTSTWPEARSCLWGTDQAQRNVTADTLKQLLLSRAEGTAYAESRARIAESVDKALTRDAKRQFRGFLQQILAPPDKKQIDLDLQLSWVPLIQKNVMPDDFKRGKLEELLERGVKLVQGGAAPQAATTGGETGAATNRPFGCEVFTANGVHTLVNYYLPLWQKLPNNRLHLEDALAEVRTRATVAKENGGSERC
jgi:hypothetical protein